MRAKEILNKQQGVAEGATVTRIDSKPITDFASNLNTYKHTDDWSQSGLDTGDDSYWTKRNIKPNTSKGLFAGDPHRTALYATGNANETRYVEYTENGQPVVYFDKKDLPAIRARKTYLSIFDASDFRKLPSGEWFSEHPKKPIKQIPINDPFEYIQSQGWKIRITNDLAKVFKQVQKMHSDGKITRYGAEGMNESKQAVEEDSLKEDVGGNYLYYSVESSDDAKLILSSGYIEASSGAQTATRQQTKLPVVSVSRSINYAVSGAIVERDYQVVFVLDRNAIESRYKTFGTSQHEPTKSDDIFWNANSANYKKFQKYSKIDTNRDGKMSDQELDAYYAIPGNTTSFDERPNAVMAQIQNKQYATLFSKYNRSKSGKEFEEVIPVKSGQLPLKGILVGFYLVPNKAAAKDQELLNHPMRLTMPRPNTFVKVTQQSVAEDISQPISEIEKLKADDVDWHPEKRTGENVTPIPDNTQYGYKESVSSRGDEKLFEFYHNNGKEYQFIGWVGLRKYSELPGAKNTWQISNTILDSNYRGRGVGVLMYKTILQQGIRIVADETQTPQAMALWAKLSETPGIQVVGLVSIMRALFDTQFMDNYEYDIKRNQKLIKAIGAKPLIDYSEYDENQFVPFVFPVRVKEIRQKNRIARQLHAPGAKLYHTQNNPPGDDSEDFTLIASWVGSDTKKVVEYNEHDYLDESLTPADQFPDKKQKATIPGLIVVYRGKEVGVTTGTVTDDNRVQFKQYANYGKDTNYATLPIDAVSIR